jgi:hypothetical protein
MVSQVSRARRGAPNRFQTVRFGLPFKNRDAGHRGCPGESPRLRRSGRFTGWDEWAKNEAGWREVGHIGLAKGGPKLVR